MKRWLTAGRRSKTEVWTDDIVEWIDEMRHMDVRPRPQPGRAPKPGPRPSPTPKANAR